MSTADRAARGILSLFVLALCPLHQCLQCASVVSWRSLVIVFMFLDMLHCCYLVKCYLLVRMSNVCQLAVKTFECVVPEKLASFEVLVVAWTTSVNVSSLFKVFSIIDSSCIVTAPRLCAGERSVLYWARGHLCWCRYFDCTMWSGGWRQAVVQCGLSLNSDSSDS